MKYDALIDEALELELKVMETHMPVDGIKGLYVDGNIFIEKELPSRCEKACVLAEEIGHAKYTVGDILDQSDLNNAKQEKIARSWSYERLLPLSSLIAAYENKIKNRYELSEYLDLTESFIEEALAYYNDKYSPYIEVGQYIIYFSPLGVLKRL